MVNKAIDMKKLRALLRLHFKGYSNRDIARSCGVSKTRQLPGHKCAIIQYGRNNAES